MKNEANQKDKYPTVEEITDLCLHKYETLAKTGKPNDNEWTVLAGIVMNDATSTNGARVIVVATGTKCLGENKMCASGLKLNDSHAEVLARRAFLRFCYEQMILLNNTENATIENQECTSIFAWNELKACYELKTNISFHFFSTRLPCGDACIPYDIEVKKQSNEAEKEKEQDIYAEEPLIKKIKYEKDTIYTGAKVIDILEREEEVSDKMAQNPCALRLKPGKGIRTSSMSCSDKLARWNIMGVQGALLYGLTLQPIYFATITILSADANISVLERAIYERFKNRYEAIAIDHADSLDLGNFKMQMPQIRVIKPSLERYFNGTQTADKEKPSPLALVWCDIRAIKNQQYQVCVDGKRQGFPSKRQENIQSALYISKYHILQTFLSLVLNNAEINERLDLRTEQGLYCYKQCKQSAKDYEQAWQRVKKNIFGKWTYKKINYENFSLPDPRLIEARTAAKETKTTVN